MKNPTQKQEPVPKAQRWERVWELEEPVLIPYGACKIGLLGWKELRAEKGGGVHLERCWRFPWRSVVVGFASWKGSSGDFEENDWPGESVEDF